jgi:serine/threonine-protein kinase RsbW
MMAANEEPTGERRVRLPRHPGSAGEARRFVAAILERRRLPARAVENARLVSSELVTNAYRHGDGEIELRVALLDDRLRLEVIDAGINQVPAVRKQHRDDGGGWGLRIVDQLALQWGVFEGTTHVWADLALA